MLEKSAIVVIGLNHETAPVEVPECLAFASADNPVVLERMRQESIVDEIVLFSTCNRVEFLITTKDATRATEAVKDFLSEFKSTPRSTFEHSLYVYQGEEAVRHIFRVASSLDSMVVGEPQILGQIKDAYYEATQEKTSGVLLNRLMHRAFHVAKRVRTETGVSDAAVSVSYAAVELAKKIFHDLQGKRVLLVGAGEMAELAARHLLRQGVGSIRVANRTFHRAVQMAKTFKGSPVSYGEIGAQLLEVDIVISSTASPEYVITHEQVKGSLRKRRNRPLFFIDIAVPRDVEPGVNGLDNVYVYDIDDLKGVIQINVAQRQAEAVKAERIVEEEVIQFEKWLKTLEVVPTIISLKDKAESIRQVELRRSLAGLADLTPSQVEMIERLTLSITEKIINDPILVLKGKADRPTRDMYLDVARRLFKLDEDDEEEHGHGPP